MSTFCRPTPGATDQATTDRGWVSVNTSGYKVWVVCFVLLCRLGLPVARKKLTPLTLSGMLLTVLPVFNAVTLITGVVL